MHHTTLTSHHSYITLTMTSCWQWPHTTLTSHWHTLTSHWHTLMTSHWQSSMISYHSHITLAHIPLSHHNHTISLSHHSDSAIIPLSHPTDTHHTTPISHRQSLHHSYIKLKTSDSLNLSFLTAQNTTMQVNTYTSTSPTNQQIATHKIKIKH